MIALAALLLAIAPQDGGKPECSGCSRPCLDYVGIGRLRTTGKTAPGGPVAAENEILIVEDSRLLYRFAERKAVVGDALGEPVELRNGANMPQFSDITAVVALTYDRKSGTRFVGWAPVWTDRKGRPFIPIFYWPFESSRWIDWRPESMRRFARPIDYAAPQPMQDTSYQLDEDTPELVQTIDGKPRPRLGVYLSDLQAMFKAAESCEAV